MCELPLSAIAEVNPAVRIPHELSGKNAVSFIPMGDVSESGQWLSKQERPLRSVSSGFTAFEEGDVLIAKITPCMENGKGAHATGLQNGIGFGSTEFHVLRARQGSDPRFVFQLTQWRRLRHAAEGKMVGSAGQQRVPRSFFDEFLVTDFRPGEQSGIARILDTLDTAIHETEAIITKLKAVKQGLLHDLLTRGIDANGELRPPQAEAPHLYKPSPLGWIPKEWAIKTLREIGDTITGGTPPSYDPLAWGEGLRFITPGDIEEEDPISATERQVSPHGQRYVRPLPPRSTLVVCIGSTIGKVGITSFESCTNQQINAVVPSPGTDHEFLFYSLQMHAGRLRALAGLQAVPIVNKSSFESILLASPPLHEQVEISSRASSASEQLAREQKLCEKLKLQKAGLMDDLLTGRVRVTPLLTEEHEGSR